MHDFWKPHKIRNLLLSELVPLWRTVTRGTLQDKLRRSLWTHGQTEPLVVLRGTRDQMVAKFPDCEATHLTDNDERLFVMVGCQRLAILKGEQGTSAACIVVLPSADGFQFCRQAAHFSKGQHRDLYRKGEAAA